MKKNWFYSAILLLTMSVGALLYAKNSHTFSYSSNNEQWINSHHLKVKVNGQWHDISLIPLSDRLCASGHQLFQKYCN